MIDLLFSRYAGGAKDILDYEFEIGIEIIHKAMLKKNEEMMFQRWIAGGYEHEISFAEFKKEFVSIAPAQSKDNESPEETLKKVKKILEMRRK